MAANGPSRRALVVAFEQVARAMGWIRITDWNRLDNAVGLLQKLQATVRRDRRN